MFRCIIAILALFFSIAPGGMSQSNQLAEHLLKVSPNHEWKLVKEIPLAFDVHHPQGIVKIGNIFYLSTVEVLQWPRGYNPPRNGYDRDTGSGNGFILKISEDGELLHKAPVGKDSLYHPGGIDFDGTYIWIPVCEYRPHSGALIYRMNPATMESEEMAYIDDSIGAIAANHNENTLHGVNWGSRRHFTWTTRGDEVTYREPSTENPSFFVDLQDCQYIGDHKMVCTGHQNYRRTPDDPHFRLGAIEIIDTKSGMPIRQIPIPKWTPSGLAITSNPSWFEADGNILRAYFAPEDDENGSIYVFEIDFSGD